MIDRSRLVEVLTIQAIGYLTDEENAKLDLIKIEDLAKIIVSLLPSHFLGHPIANPPVYSKVFNRVVTPILQETLATPLCLDTLDFAGEE